MKVKDFILKFISRACCVCVAISLLFFTVAQIIMATSLENEVGISFSQYALFLLFSFLLCGAAYLFRLPLPKALNLLIHYLVCAVCFFVMFSVTGKLQLGNFGKATVFFVIFTLFYALFFGIYLLFTRVLLRDKTRSQKKAEEVYEKRF